MAQLLSSLGVGTMDELQSMVGAHRAAERQRKQGRSRAPEGLYPHTISPQTPAKEWTADQAKSIAAPPANPQR